MSRSSWQLIFRTQTLGLIGAACFGLFLIIGTDRLRLRERYLMALSVVAAIAAIAVLPAPWPLLSEAAQRAAYLSAFFLMLTLLRDGAMTSSSARSRPYMTQQPPSRRYWALAGGWSRHGRSDELWRADPPRAPGPTRCEG